MSSILNPLKYSSDSESKLKMIREAQFPIANCLQVHSCKSSLFVEERKYPFY